MFSKQYVRSTLLRGLAALVLALTQVSVAAAAPAAGPHALAPRTAGISNCSPFTTFSSKNFSSPTRINNQWLPMAPGTQLTLEGRSNSNGATLPHTVIFTVTGLTKVINGVRTVVVWDRDFSDGALTEAELAFFAQDNRRTVWNLGEYPEEYEGGVFVGAPSTWLSGVNGAKGGVHMPSDPQVGTPGYLQGRSLTIDFLDCAQVFATGETVSVPAGWFDDVLVTDEWSPLDPASGHQRKYHAAGVGIVQVGAVDDPEGETLVLVQAKHLSPRALDKANDAAMKLDKHGRQVSAIYRQAPPAQEN